MQSGDEDEARALWGFQDNEDGLASLFTVEDGVVEGESIPEVRDGVGIDPATGAATRRIKYTTTVLPRGTRVRFSCSLAVDHDGDTSRAEDALKMLIGALRHGSIRLGAQRTRGMGKVVLEDERLRCATLDTRQGMIDHLRGHDSDVRLDDLEPVLTGRNRRIDITVQWHATEPVMVKSGAGSIAIDSLPLVSGIDDSNMALTLPGSSLKGVLRSRAALIVSTAVGGTPNAQGSAAEALVRQLFGTSRADVDKDAKNGGMGMLAIDDCYAETTLKRSAWAKVGSALDEADVRTALSGSPLEGKLPTVTHVAIDRWTGGASDKKLFNQMEPRDLSWEPMCLTLDLSRLEDVPPTQKAMVALLLLTLRDLASGRVPLGFGTNRGMGSVAVDRVTITPSGVDWMQDMATLDKGDIKTLPCDLLSQLDEAWQTAIDGHQGGE